MKLLKLLLVSAVLAATSTAYAQKADAPKAAAAPAPTAAKDAKAELIDINSADEKTLMTLKGIGDVTAGKIVKGRPYAGKDDLAKKKIVTEKVYADIKEQIIAKQKK